MKKVSLMRKALLMLLAVSMAAALFAGCQPGGGGGSAATTAAGADADASTTAADAAAGATSDAAAAAQAGAGAGGENEGSGEMQEWTYLISEFVNAPLSNEQDFYKEIEKRYNVRFVFEVVNSADLTTKLNLALASDIPPNMIASNPGSVSRYYNTGVFVDLAPYVAEHGEDFTAEINKDPLAVKNMLDDEGRQFFMPRIYWDYESTYLAMDKDFLDEIGKPIPATTEEFADALTEIHELHPDVYFTRGQWNGGAHSLQTPIYHAFGTYHRFVHFKEDEYLFGPYERREEMREALKYLNRLYTAGAIDPEFLTIDQDSYIAKMTAKQVSAVYGWMGGPNMWPIDENGENFPDAEYNWKVVPALKGPGGHQHEGVMTIADMGTYITKSHPDPAKAVEVFNWYYTEEGIEFRNWGILGETYEVVDGVKQYTAEIKQDDAGLMNGLRKRGLYPAIDTFVSDFEAYSAMIPETMAIGIEANRPYRMASTPALTPTDEENDTIAQLGVDILALIDESLPKFITGELSVDDDYDGYISQLESMNVQQYIDANKSQYERWKNR